MSTSLVMVEVSQKQAYIFASNKLQDNVRNSAIIAYVTSNRYFDDVAKTTGRPELYCKEENEVYCGGGHAILQFASENQAKEFIRAITLEAKKRFQGLELFATIYTCEGEPDAGKIFKLIQKLEKKKSIRRASFSQGTFGVEAVETATGTVTAVVEGQEIYPVNYDLEPGIDRCIYISTMSFECLGGDKEANFIAIVHIDGNAMGKRVQELREDFAKGEYGDTDWKNYRRILKQFSDAIDMDFKSAFIELCVVVEKNIKDGRIGKLKLKKSKEGKIFFPIRKIITEGDDICFVTDGRIGIECARIFIEIMTSENKKNIVDKKNYAVAAGVAIVHRKYPFYRAYELSEQLCTNAKKYIANSTQRYEGKEGAPNSANISAIDWHIEFGEMEDELKEIRKKYTTMDGKQMEIRPYFVVAPEEYKKEEKYRNYKNFRRLISALESNDIAYARGKIKELRRYIRGGEIEVLNYLMVNRMEELIRDCYIGIYENADISKIGTGEQQMVEGFIETIDEKKQPTKRSTMFDAIEMMDTFIPLEYGEEE